MKNNIFILIASATFFFYSGFYANQYIHPVSCIANKTILDNIVSDTTSNILISQKPRIKSQINIGVNSTPSNRKEEKHPHELEHFEVTTLEKENLFYINQESEIEFHEALLVSMKENNFAEADIAEIKNNMDQINSAQFVDNLTEKDEYSEAIIISKMREGLSESLYKSGDLSNEEIKKMAYHMLHDEESENNLLASSDNDTSIPPHELEIQ